jgi:hypothetical protein
MAGRPRKVRSIQSYITPNKKKTRQNELKIKCLTLYNENKVK